jgi:hypothetical protein
MHKMSKTGHSILAKMELVSTIIIEELRWVHGGKGQVAQLDRVKTTMTCPDTGFLQPIKFQEMGATTQHQCGTQI